MHVALPFVVVRLSRAPSYFVANLAYIDIYHDISEPSYMCTLQLLHT